jgi:hypothetical protein
MKAKNGWLLYKMNHGLIDQDDPVVIAKAKKDYLAQYKRRWRTRQKGRGKQYKVFLTNQELKEVISRANACSLSITAFIKQSAISEARSKRLVPTKEELSKIYSMLHLTHSRLEKGSTFQLDERLEILQGWFQRLFKTLSGK